MELGVDFGPETVSVALTLVPFAGIGLLSCFLDDFALTMSLIFFEEADIEVAICISFVSISFAHVIFPFAFVNFQDLISWYKTLFTGL